MNDVSVKQTDVLRQYAAMLQKFGSSQIALCVALQRKAEKKREELNSFVRDIEGRQNSLQEKVHELKVRYDEARGELESTSQVLWVTVMKKPNCDYMNTLTAYQK